MPIPKLDDEAVTRALSGRPAWARDGDLIRRRVELASFRHAIRVVNRIADAAEGADHHPDLRLSYRTLEIELTTHDAGGLSARDLALAKVIDDILADG